MVSLGELAPAVKPTGRRYLTGRPDDQETAWRKGQKYLVPKKAIGEAPHGKKTIPLPKGGAEYRHKVARQFPEAARRSAYDVGERVPWDHIARKTMGVPHEEALETTLGFKKRVTNRRNGIPKVGMKEVTDMWPGYFKQEGLIPGACICAPREKDVVGNAPDKVIPLTYEERKRRERLRDEIGDVSVLTNASGHGDDVLKSWEERTGLYVWKTKAVRQGLRDDLSDEEDAPLAPSKSADAEAEPEAAPEVAPG